MRIILNYEQINLLQRKLEEDKELEELLPIREELDVLYEKRKESFKKVLNCQHDWCSGLSGYINPYCSCKKCGLLYHARNKKRDLQTFEEEFQITIEIN